MFRAKELAVRWYNCASKSSNSTSFLACSTLANAKNHRKNYQRMERSEKGGDFCAFFAKILPVPFIILAPPVTSSQNNPSVKKASHFSY